MKRLWIACAILAAIFAAALGNAHYLGGFTGQLTDLLEQAEAKAEVENWEAADALTRLALQKWQGHDAYLHIAFRHTDVDEVYTGFREVLEFIQCQESGEYSAANARLIAHIGLLYEEEQLTLQNIL